MGGSVSKADSKFKNVFPKLTNYSSRCEQFNY